MGSRRNARWHWSLFVCLTLSLIWPGSVLAQQIVLKAGHIQKPDHPFHLGVVEFAKRVAASLSNSHIELTLDCEEDIESYGIANELGQVVLNLIVNAKDASLERHIAAPRITVNLSRNQEEVLISVEDNAGGIDPMVGERIFDPYFTTKSMGTGIGLYMARIIVERHFNGHIAYANTGAGTRFDITFPLRQDDTP